MNSLRVSIAWVISSALATALVGCSTSSGGDLPDGVSCGSTIDGGTTGTELTDALGKAHAGQCVIVHDAVYDGNFAVPAGVTLVAERGADAQFKSTSTEKPAIDLADSPDSALVGIHIVAAASDGIHVHQNGRLIDVIAQGAKRLAIEGYEGPDAIPSGTIVLHGVHVTDNVEGIWIDGFHVVAEGGDISRNKGEMLSAGLGFVATGGARVELDGTNIEGNDYGVLLDGATLTAHLTDVRVASSGERGVWAQNLKGSAMQPALTIDGTNTVFESNALCGLGTYMASGVVMSAGAIRGTIAKPIVTDLQTTENVGDGLALEISSSVKVTGITLQDNARTQALIAGGGADIAFQNVTVSATGAELKIVVQDTSSMVAVDPMLISMSAKLGIAPSVALPAPP